MPTVNVPSALRKLTGGLDRVTVPGATLGDVIDRMEELHPGIKERLVRDGKLRGSVAVFVNDQLPTTGLRTRLAEDDEVYFAPAIAGG